MERSVAVGGQGASFSGCGRKKVDGLIVVDEAFVVVVRPAGGHTSLLNVFIEQLAFYKTQRFPLHQFVNLAIQHLYLFYDIRIILLDLQLGFLVDVYIGKYLSLCEY